MVEGTSWFGAVLLPQGLDSLLSSMKKMNSQVYQDILQENVRLSVRQLKINKSWLMQQDNDPKPISKSTEWLQQKKIRLLEWPVRVLTSTQLRCCGMTSREQFTPDIPRILLNWNSFVKRNGPKFLLTVVQVWSTTTENIWLRLLLPKEGQPVIKSKGSHTFPTLHCECLHSVFNKDMKTIVCVLLV